MRSRIGLLILTLVGQLPSQLSATPNTFAQKAYEMRVSEVYSPMNPAGAITGGSKNIQSDPALARVMNPNMYCVDSSGNPIPNCGIPNQWDISKNFAGGQKERVLNFMPPNATVMDLNMATTLANEYTSLLAGPVNQIATTYVYADPGTAAGLNQSIEWSGSMLNAYNLSLNHLNAQMQDPVIGDLIATKVNGCIKNQLKGGAHGNWPMAFSMCTSDRSVSAGNFFATVGQPAKLGDVPQHAPTGGFVFGGPPSMPDNQHSVLAEIFNPLIYSAPLFSFMPDEPSKSDYIDLYNDAKKILGDVIYTDTYEPEGATVSNIERWRSNNPNDEPSAIFRSMLKETWTKASGLLFKMCMYTNSKDDIDVSSHDALPWSALLGSPSNFWDSFNGPGLYKPTSGDLLGLSFQSFQFKAVAADLLFAQFKHTQEQKEPTIGKGRQLDCDLLNPTFGGKARFEDLLMGSGGLFSFGQLKEFRQYLFEVSLRITLGQWLDTLRTIHQFFKKVSPTFSGGSTHRPTELAFEMLYETAGVANAEELEGAFTRNRQFLLDRFEGLESKYASELGRGSGTISEMFSDVNNRGDRGSASSSPMGAT